MDDSNIPEALPKSPDESRRLESAIERLLTSIPEVWTPVDQNDLTSFDQRAQLLLVAAGMIERRMEMKVQSFLGSYSAVFEVIATGECGFAEALKPLIREMWTAIGKEWEESRGMGAPFHCEITSDSWRLTDQGVIARDELASTPRDRQFVFDFVLRQGLACIRPQVHGAGRLVKIVRGDGSRTESAPEPPTPVAITNWDEGIRLFREEVEKAVEAAFARKPRYVPRELPVVSIDPPQIVIEGKAFALSLDGAHYLDILTKHYGERMSDREVVRASDYLQISFSDRPRLKVVRESLPSMVQAWIDTNESGSKLRCPPA